MEGIDVVLLDEETSVGKNPVECIQIVSLALA
jgi:pyruvate kinase